jgi:hypothetical protein
MHKSIGNRSSKPPRGSRGVVLLGFRVWRGRHWGGELVLVSACLTVSPLITRGQAHTRMKEGVNQGCPLSPIFATLVLHRVLKPLDKQLQQRAAAHLASGISGDNGFGSLAHLFAYMDDISSTVALEDVQFFCEEIEKLGTPRGCFINPLKTRILTSCDGHSILPQLQ